MDLITAENSLPNIEKFAATTANGITMQSMMQFHYLKNPSDWLSVKSDKISHVDRVKSLARSANSSRIDQCDHDHVRTDQFGIYSTRL